MVNVSGGDSQQDGCVRMGADDLLAICKKMVSQESYDTFAVTDMNPRTELDHYVSNDAAAWASHQMPDQKRRILNYARLAYFRKVDESWKISGTR